jgi:hypothetical protein
VEKGHARDFRIQGFRGRRIGLFTKALSFDMLRRSEDDNFQIWFAGLLAIPAALTL